MTLWRGRTLGRPLVFVEGQLIDWSLSLAVRMLVRGVEIKDSGSIPRRELAHRIWATFKHWFAWATALPGDRFWDFQRDLLVEVAHGTPRRRTVRLVTCEALHYPVVQRLGIDAIFALTNPEPCPYTWATVTRWRPGMTGGDNSGSALGSHGRLCR